MKLTKETNILIVGLGLMGGSYAIALKKKGYRVGGIAHRRVSLEYALENGIVDYGADFPDPELIGRADLLVFALYPHTFVEWIETYQRYFKPGALLTDVTGVKTAVVYRIQKTLRPDVEFVAAHPMTGREVYGVQNSTDRTFGEANYIVTPTGSNTEENIEAVKKLGAEMGFARISELTPEAHDEMIAFVSQLSHVIAVTLMTCNELEGLENYTGNSFRDLTRIAHINEDMWSELFTLNKAALLKEMDLFSAQFDRLRRSLAEDDTDTMKAIMRRSTERRDAFDEIVTERKKEVKKL